MIKCNYKKWRFLSFIFLTILYACTSEQDYLDNNTKKLVEPLTVLSARSYYNSVYNNSTPKLKSNNKEQVLLIPNWNIAQLYTDSLWYVVESPVEFEKGIRTILMSSDVSSRVGSQNMSDVKQVLRLVIARNKDTGKTVSFIMAVLPDYDYMKQKGNAICENKYLTRAIDLYGAVLFFGIDGQFVNGWIYENGEIIAYTLSRNSNFGGTKAKSTYCWEQITSVIDASGQETEIGHNFYCEESGSGGGVDMSDRGNSLINTLENGGINNDYRDPSVGGGIDFSDNNSNIKEKKPVVRTDCTEKAAQNAQLAKTSIGDNNTKNGVNELRGKISANSEYSTAINYSNDTYSIKPIVSGNGSYVAGDFSQSTVYGLHTHNGKGGGYAGPSVGDIYTLMEANSYFYNKYGNNNYNMYGVIIFAFDGSEYLVSFNDRSQANTFFYTNGNLFKPDLDDNFFKDSSMYTKFVDIQNSLIQNGYSKQDSYDYAMSYMLDNYNTGVRISKKESGKTDFKEMKTENNSTNNYQPKICP